MLLQETPAGSFVVTGQCHQLFTQAYWMLLPLRDTCRLRGPSILSILRGRHVGSGHTAPRYSYTHSPGEVLRSTIACLLSDWCSCKAGLVLRGQQPISGYCPRTHIRHFTRGFESASPHFCYRLDVTSRSFNSAVTYRSLITRSVDFGVVECGWRSVFVARCVSLSIAGYADSCDTFGAR